MTGVDLERFVAICGACGEDAAGLAAFYLTYMAEQLDSLRAAIADHRVADVERIAHRCVGSSGTYGLDPIVTPLAALERQAHDGRLENAPALEAGARTAFAQIEAALRTLMTARTPQP